MVRRCLVEWYVINSMFVMRRAFLFKRTVHSFVLFKRFFYVQAENASQELMKDLRKAQWMWKHKNKEMKEFLRQCYSKNEGTYSYGLELISLACGPGDSSSDLVFAMVTSFHDYLQKCGIAFNPSLIEKTEILSSVLIYKNYKLLQLVNRVFKISEESHYFKGLIENLVQHRKLTEAALCVRVLNLQQDYAVEEILLPLLLEGKVQAAAIYMADDSDLQLKVVKILDSFLIRNKTKPANPTAHINLRLLFKTLSTLLSSFNIPTSHCKNMHYIRSKGAINLLIRRRAEQSVSETTWQEMVMAVIGENEDLKEFLISKLLSRKDMKTAKEMADKLKIPDSKLSALLSTYSELAEDDKTEIVEDICNENDDSNVDGSDNLVFTLNSSDIKLIGNKKDFIDCISTISKNYDIIGIDSEWKPHFGLATERLSLIQLAVHDRVFILDMLSLMECLEAEDWDKFMDDIFGNPNIIKLGCGIMCDVQMIVQSNKGTKGKPIKFSHILDISLFYQKLQEVYPEKMGHTTDEDKSSNIGLSKLCEIILGKPLSKEERLCDWEKRPLKESQIQYAALDAHCLLLMYEKLKQDAMEKDMNFSHLSKVAIILTTGLWKPKKKFKGNKTEKACYIRPPVHIKEFKVIVDPELCKLGKELKLFGADVLIPKDSYSPDSVVELSVSAKRIIICGKALFKQIKDKVNEGFCFNASLSYGEEVTASHILQHFNVQFSAKNILRPCTICKSDECVVLSSKDKRTFQELLANQMSSEHCISEENNLKLFSNELQTALRDMMEVGTYPSFGSMCDDSNQTEFKVLCIKCGKIQ